MSDVFISYSKTDRHQAEALGDDLKLHGYSVWWDTELYGGEDFHDVILKALDDASAVIVIWSDSSVKSPWVRGEAQHAQSQQKLIPTKFANLRDTDIPLNFRALHTELLEDRDRILRAVERLAGSQISGRTGQASAPEGRADKPAATIIQPARAVSRVAEAREAPQTPRRGNVIVTPGAVTAIGIGVGAIAGFLAGLLIIMFFWLPAPGQTVYFVGPGPAPGYTIVGAIGGLVGRWLCWKERERVPRDQWIIFLVYGSAIGAILAVVLANIGGLITPITHLFWAILNKLLA